MLCHFAYHTVCSPCTWTAESHHGIISISADATSAGSQRDGTKCSMFVQVDAVAVTAAPKQAKTQRSDNPVHETKIKTIARATEKERLRDGWMTTMDVEL